MKGKKGFLIYVVLPLTLAFLWSVVVVPLLLSQVNLTPDIAQMANAMLEEKAKANASEDDAILIWASVSDAIASLDCDPVDFSREEIPAEDTGTDYAMTIIRINCGEGWKVPFINEWSESNGETDFAIQTAVAADGSYEFVGLQVYGLHSQLNVVWVPDSLWDIDED